MLQNERAGMSKVTGATRFIAFFSQLKERKVLRVAVAYIVVAWMVVQVGEVIFGALKLPEWSQSLLVVICMLGFPIALVLAWAYEVTPEGLVHDLDGRSGHEVPISSSQHVPVAVAQRPRSSIAVLPFEDMSCDQDQMYFCEGVAEEILCALNDVEGLRVAARVASFQFGSKSADIVEIGRKLNVSVVLEGSLRKSNDQIRITIQLIDVHDGYQFWAGQYTHDLQGVFEIQEQIATAVVRAMRLSIGESALTRPMTKNTEAYDLYLKGNSYFKRPDKQNILYARRLFERAVEVDPNFGRAWANLASTYAYDYLFSRPDDNLRQQAMNISEKALRLSPGVPQVHVARGISYSIFENYKQADLEFDVAVGLDPDSFSAWFTWARSKTYEGDFEKAAAFYQKASEARPGDFQSVLLQMSLLTDFGDAVGAKEKAEEGLQQAKEYLEVKPDDYRAWNMGAFAQQYLGKKEKAKKWMDTSLANSPRSSLLSYNAASFFMITGEKDKAMRYLSEAADSGCLNLSWLAKDSSFNSVRDDPVFKDIVERFRGVS